MTPWKMVSLRMALAMTALIVAARPATSHAVEVVPSIGLTHDFRSGDEHLEGGLALRAGLGPAVAGEVSARYHREDGEPGRESTRVWPVTASLWLAPLGPLYAGGGVGWYSRTIDQGARRVIDRDFGAHAGAGIRFPLAPGAAFDIGGRYAIVGDVGNRLAHPHELKADQWTVSAGLTLGF